MGRTDVITFTDQFFNIRRMSGISDLTAETPITVIPTRGYTVLPAPLYRNPEVIDKEHYPVMFKWDNGRKFVLIDPIIITTPDGTHTDERAMFMKFMEIVKNDRIDSKTNN